MVFRRITTPRGPNRQDIQIVQIEDFASDLGLALNEAREQVQLGTKFVTRLRKILNKISVLHHNVAKEINDMIDHEKDILLNMTVTPPAPSNLRLLAKGWARMMGQLKDVAEVYEDTAKVFQSSVENIAEAKNEINYKMGDITKDLKGAVGASTRWVNDTVKLRKREHPHITKLVQRTVIGESNLTDLENLARKKEKYIIKISELDTRFQHESEDPIRASIEQMSRLDRYIYETFNSSILSMSQSVTSFSYKMTEIGSRFEDRVRIRFLFDDDDEKRVDQKGFQCKFSNVMRILETRPILEQDFHKMLKPVNDNLIPVEKRLGIQIEQPITIFGGTISDIMRLEEEAFQLSDPLREPIIFSWLLDEVARLRGHYTKGIFRVPAEQTILHGTRNRLLNFDYSLEEKTSPYVPAELLKQWLRDISEPVIPFNQYDRAVNIASAFMENGERLFDECRSKLEDFLLDLPTANQFILYRLTGFAYVASDELHQPRTNLSLHSLATLFTPNLIKRYNEVIRAEEEYFQTFGRELAFILALMAYIIESNYFVVYE